MVSFKNSCVNFEMCSFPFGCEYNCRNVFFLGTSTIPEITHSGGLFPRYVSLQNLNKSFLNLGSPTRQWECHLVLGLFS